MNAGPRAGTDPSPEEPKGSWSGGGIASGAGDRSSGTPVAGLRGVRRRWAGGVAVVTTCVADGHRGATVGAFAVASLEPPLVLVCLDAAGAFVELVADAGVFAVSILDRNQEFSAERFAARAPLPDSRLSGIPHALAANGCAVLAGSLAWLGCRVAAIHGAGDHRIVVGAVEETWLGPDSDDPLLTYEGRYRGLEGA